MIKTYRGLLADGGQDHIRLKTNKGDVGYRILKLELMPESPHDVQQVSVISIWKIIQSTIPTANANIDFTDGDLLAASIGWFGAVSSNISQRTTTIFDREIFNQDIYITHTDNASNQKCNYYIELEQVKLNENESTMATLQSLRRLGLPRN